jgi:hypothetical protein
LARKNGGRMSIGEQIRLRFLDAILALTARQ